MAAKQTQKRNYQKELERILFHCGANDTCRGQNGGCAGIGNTEAPTLLLHSCCAPCSSYVLEYLSQYFRITVLYYNPNIYPEEEYERRVQEQERLIAQMQERNVQAQTATDVEAAAGGSARSETEVSRRYPITFMKGRFDSREFYEAVRSLEHIPEGGERCFACFRLRLREAAEVAAAGNFDYFTTTLTISPLKSAPKLNEIGEELARQYHVRWLPSDFKKKNGYKRSIELSAEYGLYRQDYCGCVFSLRERQAQRASAENVHADCRHSARH